jgi:hypothetical protein
VFSSAIDEAVEEALHPPAPEKSRNAAKKNAAAKKPAPERRAKAKKDIPPKGSTGSDAGRRRARNQNQRSTPPPAVNEPLTFINFVAAFPVGSTIEGEVVSFTSHGAMVDVPLPGGGAMHCYIPLTAMGTPPPTKARQVLKKGEVRGFVLAGLDPPRRVAELAIDASTPVGEKPVAVEKAAATRPKHVPTTKAAPAAKKAAKKATAKKAAAPTKKAAKKAAAAVKKAPKKAPAKKAAKAKKLPAKKLPAKKAPAKKAPAKKARKARAD